jgi:hypothetical protein
MGRGVGGVGEQRPLSGCTCLQIDKCVNFPYTIEKYVIAVSTPTQEGYTKPLPCFGLFLV